MNARWDKSNSRLTDGQSVCSKAVTRVTAAGDRVVRAGAGLALTATFAPSLLRESSRRRDLQSLDFYLEAGSSGDPTRLFETPSGVPQVTKMPGRRHRLNAKVDIVENLRYLSGYVPANPVMRASFGSFERNRYAWAQHWRHGDRPRPTIIVAHGFTLSSWAFNSTFLAMQSYFSRGYDVVLVTSPFHGPRRDSGDVYNGSGLFSHGFGHAFEGIAQGVHDIRSLVTYLLDTGAPGVGLTGLSLGGLLSSLVAETDARIAFAIPNAPPTNFAQMIQLWGRLGPSVERALSGNGVDPERFTELWAAFSPLNYPRLLPRDRLMIIAGRGDRLVMPEHVEGLWTHWDRPAIHWYVGSHIAHVGRRAYLRHMAEFIEGTGFAEGLEPETGLSDTRAVGE